MHHGTSRQQFLRRGLAPMALIAPLVAACGTSATPTGLEIVDVDSDAAVPSLVPGDAVKLAVVEGFSDGSHGQLASGTTITFAAPIAVAALPSGSTAASPFPPFASAPTAVFITNAERLDRASDLDSVLFVVDGGTLSGSITVTATLSGATTGSATATIPVTGSAAGSVAHGEQLYTVICANCHGSTGGGSPANPDGSFTLDGADYDFPAPGLNAMSGNLAANPDWSAALLAVAARADISNVGVTLRAPMPDWLTTTVSGALLSTQDFKDIYTYLQTVQ